MGHPILAAAAAVRESLAAVAGVNPSFMSTPDKATALVELAAAEAQLAELRLRVLADADDVAATTAAAGPGEWLAHATRARVEDARAEHRLALALDRRYQTLAAAMATGEVNPAQAHLITRALDALPGDIGPEILARAETVMIDHAHTFGPRPLAHLARHLLQIIAPQIADEAEARHLATLEAAAHRKTRLTLRRLGNGTTRLSGLIPDLTAARLTTYLEAFTNPANPTGVHALPADNTTATHPTPTHPQARLTYPRRLGEAFTRLLEVIDPHTLPRHAGDATTLLVTITLDQLRTHHATADLIGTSHTPGDDHPTQITAHHARYLACTAGIIPLVLGGHSEILDLGRTRRLFTPAQRKALHLRDQHCRAEGCTTPSTWCDAHHLNPWTTGGPTNLANALLLCPHHHTQAHNPTYTTQHLPNGNLRYHRRT